MSETKLMTIRLPDELHARLSRAAERSHRSKHAQMLVYIERCLNEDEKEAGHDGSK